MRCFVKPGRFVQGPPAVKYRGIFLNDEAPDLTGWANEKFGGYNHQFYEKIFELLLRLKAIISGRRCGTTLSTRTIR